MRENLPLTTEPVDDVPLWLTQLERIGLQALLDAHFPTHGNWVGLSLGWVSVLWLPPHPLQSRPSADPRQPLGGAATSHAAGVHRAAGAAVRCQRRLAGHRAEDLERRYALEHLWWGPESTCAARV